MKNFGKVPVILGSTHIKLKEDLVFTLMEPMNDGRFPFELKPQDNFTIDYSIKRFNQMLLSKGLSDINEISAGCIDKLGNKYSSNKIIVLKDME